MEEQERSYEQYLADLPEGRRKEIATVWQVVRDNIGTGYTEHITSKFLIYKAGEEWLCALGNQKNYISMHLMPIYFNPALKEKLYSAGKKLKGGKGCVNFVRAEELPLQVLGEIIGLYDAQTYQRNAQRIREESRAENRQRGASRNY